MNAMKRTDIVSKKSILRIGAYTAGLGLLLALIPFSGHYSTAYAKEGGVSIGVVQFAGDDKDKSIQKGIIGYLQADVEKNPELKGSVTISPISMVVAGSSRQEQEAFTLQTGIKEKMSVVIWGEITGEDFRPNVTWINTKPAEPSQYGDTLSRLPETIAFPIQSLKKPSQLALFVSAITALERGKKTEAAGQFDQVIHAISKNVHGDIYLYNAFAYYTSSSMASDSSPLIKSVELFNSALKAYQEEKNWGRAADVQHNLGLTLRKLASLGIDSEKNLRLSLVAIQEATQFMKKNKNEVGYATTQYSLGRTYQTLAALGIEPEQNLNYSISAFNEAVQIEKKQKNNVGYVYAQSSLGGSYRALAQWGVSPEQNLKLSIDALKEAGKVDKDEKNANLLTAMVQKSIGVSYQGLAQWGIDPQTNLKSAIDTLKNAAILEKKQENIKGYADVLNDLGMSYQALAQWGNEPRQNLEQSIAVFQEAALYGKGEKDGYATTQNNLGMAYFTLAQQGVQSEQNFNRSIAALIEAALVRKEQKSWKEYAMIQNNLGMAYRELANRSIESEKNLKISVDILKEVSGLWKQQKNGAAGYAMAQNNLGLSYQALSDRGVSPEENKKNADEAFHESREPKAVKK